MMTLKEYVEKRKAGAGPSRQEDLADEIGISRSYLAEILSGAKRPGRDAIEKIDRATHGEVPPSVWFHNPASCDGAAK